MMKSVGREWFGNIAAGAFSIALLMTAAAGVARAQQQAPTGLDISRSSVTGLASFVTARGGGPIPAVRGVAPAGPDVFFAQYGKLFGVKDAAKELLPVQTVTDSLGYTHSTYRQVHRGVPVFSGILKVHRNAAGQVVAANGDFYPIPDKLNLVPVLSAERAAAIAIERTGLGTPVAESSALVLVDPGWYGDPVAGVHLAYYLIVSDPAVPVRDAFFVDAHNGTVLDRWSVLPTARFRQVYDGMGGASLPGTLMRSEGGPAVGGDVDRAYDYSGDVYDYYFRAFGRDSIDNNGMTMILTANSTAPPCPNAFWNGQQMVFCTGTVTDDITAHEITHGVTERTAGLIYQNQSGQLNEGYSDIFGELIDLYNGDASVAGPPTGPPNWPAHATGPGQDTPNNARSACSSPGSNYPDGVRWLMGEDATAFGGAIRDMWDPTCFGDPDRANSPFETCAPGDAGGVHSGSGVPNHAVAIMSDGQNFNGFSVSAIGPIKTGAVWYRALTVYLTPASDFQSAFTALNQAAADLIGTTPNDPRTGAASGSVFTSADATQVDNALQAVEMNTPGACGAGVDLFNPAAPTLCSPQQSLFFEGFESGAAGWTVSNSNPPTPYDWVLDSTPPAGHTGTVMFAADPSIGDCAGNDESGLHSLFSPTIALPVSLAQPMVSFGHSVATEPAWDGGHVSVRVNGGAWQLVGSAAFTYNPYNLTLNASGNPIGGQEAFSGVDSNWVTSVIDLSGFVSSGDNLQLRFDLGKDGCTGVTGWWVDDVSVFDCSAGCTGPADCNDGIPCTVDTCNTGTGACVFTPDNTQCPDDGLFCNGVESCNAAGGCVSSGNPCTGGNVCDEPTNACIPPPVVGGCCVGTTCSIETQAGCLALTGLYLGDGTDCTGTAGTTTVYSANPGVAIPDGGGVGNPATNTINVPDSVTIGDIDIDLLITHTWVGDLTVEIAHGGTTATILDRPGVPASTFGCDQDNYNIILDDEGTGGAIETACALNLSSPPNYVPNQGLSAFDGMDSLGAWTITVYDDVASDPGTLDGWSVHVTALTGPCTGGCTLDSQCDDGLFCNGAETCVAGACQAGTPPILNDGVVCTIDSCDEAANAIVHTPDNTVCDNALFCDGVETCDLLLDCQAGIPPLTDDGVVCTIDSCDEAANAIVHTPDNTVCANGLFCDGVETCDVLLDCQSGTPPATDDGVACTVDFCDEATNTLVHVPLDAMCDNGLFCDGSETCDPVLDCQTGTSVNCDDSNVCTADSCDNAAGACAHVDISATCDDGNLCTMDSCDAGMGCVNTPQTCPMGEICDPADGQCVVCTSNADCDDGLFCNGAEQCVGRSACLPGSDPCDDGISCTSDQCNEATDTCVPVPLDFQCDNGVFCDGLETCDVLLGCQPGSPIDCNDGNACTSDSCDNMTAACVHTDITADCDDGNPCTDNACDPMLGCITTDNTLPCDDADACTSGDTCMSGTCQGTVVNCDDGDGCTVDACDPATGCFYDCAPAATACAMGPGLGSGACDGACACVATGPSCISAADCCDADGNGIRDTGCQWCACDAGTCGNQAVAFADMGGALGNCMPDGFCNLADALHALTCFAGTNTCETINVDAGGAFGDCAPDGFCNLADALHALTCFAETNPCTCGPAPETAFEPLVVGSTVLTSVARRRVVRPGDTVEVRVFMNEAMVNFQSYQLHVAGEGGRSGQLALVDIVIEDRADYAFADSAGSFDAFNVATGQMLSGLYSEGVATSANTYLATFVYRVSDDAAGAFVVDVLHNARSQDQTFLVSSFTNKIEVKSTVPAVITVLGDRVRSGR